jgi:hypothetical protein
MHTACFDQHWSSSGVSKIADEAAVLSSISLIFGYALVYAPMFNIKLLKALKSMLHVRRLITKKKKSVICNRIIQYYLTH